MNYLDIDFNESFDIVTLIFYDFCALNTAEQNILLEKIHAALKENGLFIFDIVTENKKTVNSTNISVYEEGFWSPRPYVEILNVYLYENPKTEGLQYAIIEEDGSTRIIRIYHRLFSLTEITKMLNENGFKVEEVYKNLKGEVFSRDSETYGIIARKV
jgi:SAM-dependent methyltransferase